MFEVPFCQEDCVRKMQWPQKNKKNIELANKTRDQISNLILGEITNDQNIMNSLNKYAIIHFRFFKHKKIIVTYLL